MVTVSGSGAVSAFPELNETTSPMLTAFPLHPSLPPLGSGSCDAVLGRWSSERLAQEEEAAYFSNGSSSL